MDIQEILKQITATDIATAGKLSATQAAKFIDYMVDSSALMKTCTFIRMPADTYELNYIAVGTRILRKGVEVTAPADVAGVTHTKRQITVEEVILPFDVSYKYLEDNLEGQDIQDTLMRLFAAQYSNDMEDLAINGLGTGGDAFLSIKAGWLALAKDSDHTGVHKVDTNGSTDYLGTIFPGLVQAMPEKWKRNPAELAIMTSPAVEEAYRLQLTARNTALGDSALVNGNRISYLGYPIETVPYLPDAVMMFGKKKNLAMGIHARDMRVEKQAQPRKRLIEVTITSRIGFEIVSDDQLVIAYDVA